MRLERCTLPPRLARLARAELALARGELALWLGYVLLPLAFACAWLIASLQGLFASWQEILLLVLGSVVLPLWIARFLARLDPERLDELLAARGALLTWLARPKSPVREILTRDLELLARSGHLEAARRSRLRRLVPRLLLYFLLFLLLALLLPGHAPGRGGFPGSSPGRQTHAGGSGAPGAGEHRPQSERGEATRPATEEREDPHADQESEDERAQPGEASPRPEEAPPRVRFSDFVVFPDFREGEGSAKRDTAEIERSPLAGADGPRPQSRPQDTPEPEDARDLEFEWQRQQERALRRGTLQPWEGRWLTRYGELLEAGRRGPARRAEGK